CRFPRNKASIVCGPGGRQQLTRAVKTPLALDGPRKPFSSHRENPRAGRVTSWFPESKTVKAGGRLLRRGRQLIHEGKIMNAVLKLETSVPLAPPTWTRTREARAYRSLLDNPNER